MTWTWCMLDHDLWLNLTFTPGNPARRLLLTTSCLLTPNYCNTVDGQILHHFEAVRNHCLLVFTGGVTVPRLLRCCRISSIHIIHTLYHSRYVSKREVLGPPVVRFYPFLGEGSPTKIDYRKKGCPYSNLSTGGPRVCFPRKLGNGIEP